MLAELRLEREQIEEAILTLERLARGRGRRRGRPPAWLKDAAAVAALAEGENDVLPLPLSPDAGAVRREVKPSTRRNRPRR